MGPAAQQLLQQQLLQQLQCTGATVLGSVRPRRVRLVAHVRTSLIPLEGAPPPPPPPARARMAVALFRSRRASRPPPAVSLQQTLAVGLVSPLGLLRLHAALAAVDFSLLAWEYAAREAGQLGPVLPRLSSWVLAAQCAYARARLSRMHFPYVPPIRRVQTRICRAGTPSSRRARRRCSRPTWRYGHVHSCVRAFAYPNSQAEVAARRPGGERVTTGGVRWLPAADATSSLAEYSTFTGLPLRGATERALRLRDRGFTLVRAPVVVRVMCHMIVFCLSVCQSVSLSVCLSACLFWLCVCKPGCLLPDWLPACLPACLYVCLSVSLRLRL